MTQIVYDGKYLYADRKTYRDGFYAGESIKLQGVRFDNITYHYAFCGSFADCSVGERVVASGFDPKVCEWAANRIGLEQLSYDPFNGIVVEVQNDNPDNHRVYLVNYAGDKCECVKGSFLVVGRNEQSVRDVHRTLTEFNVIASTASIIRFAMKGTDQDQAGFIIDRVNLRTNEYEKV